MKSNKFKEEINKIEKKNRNKYLYFCWKNKVDNSRTKFSTMTREDFTNRYKISDCQIKLYNTRWEGSPEYNYLYSLLMDVRSMQDLYKIYSVVRDKALKGDDKAVKTFLLLKREINKINIEKSDIPQKDNEIEINDNDDLDISEE